MARQQKFTILTMAPPALLVTCQLEMEMEIGAALDSVTEWPVEDIQVPSKYIMNSSKGNLIQTLINILVTDPA